MIEQIIPGLWRIEVPLPNNPLRSINSYVIKGDGRFLIIDTGMNVKESIAALTAGLKTLEVDLERTDFFITHLHHDHMGLLSTLITERSKVYFNQPEMAVLMELTDNKRWMRHLNTYPAHGFPLDKFKVLIAAGTANMYGPSMPKDFIVMKDGDYLVIGDFHLRCIWTPGHSPGHICLYEENKKILFSGDHILFDITPHISYWYELDNSLGKYLESLDKIYSLDVELVLPGHRKRRDNQRARIKELHAHHDNRLREISAVLEDGENNAYYVASRITWEIATKKWEHFPGTQKFFAVGETIAHLDYLVVENKVKKRSVDGKILYRLS